MKRYFVLWLVLIAALLFSLILFLYPLELINKFEQNFNVSFDIGSVRIRPWTKVILRNVEIRADDNIKIKIPSMQVLHNPWYTLGGYFLFEGTMQDFTFNGKKIESASFLVRFHKKGLRVEWLEASGQNGSIRGYGDIEPNYLNLNFMTELDAAAFANFMAPAPPSSLENNGKFRKVFVRIYGEPHTPTVKITGEGWTLDFKYNASSIRHNAL